MHVAVLYSSYNSSLLETHQEADNLSHTSVLGRCLPTAVAIAQMSHMACMVQTHYGVSLGAVPGPTDTVSLSTFLPAALRCHIAALFSARAAVFELCVAVDPYASTITSITSLCCHIRELIGHTECLKHHRTIREPNGKYLFWW